MGIIREEEQNAREKHLATQGRIDDPLKYAMVDLKASKTSLLDDLLKSVRFCFIKTGKLEAVVDFSFESSIHLVGNEEAQNLIAEWLHEMDPTLAATVKIGPDCSGNLKYSAELVVTFISVAEQALRSEILAELGEIVEYVTGIGPDEVTLDKSFVDDLDIDSLSSVEIAVQVEDQYGFKIHDEDLSGLQTVQKAVDYIVADIRDNPVATCRVLEKHHKHALVPLVRAYTGLVL